MLQIPGVVGVGSGTDERGPVLKVYVSKKTKALERRLTALLQGEPFVVEAIGEIQPLQ